jgi:hypothetical protein
VEGYQHVAAAHDALCNGHADPRRRLEMAAVSFWKALPHSDDWPPAFRQKALAVSERLFDRGSLPTTILALTPREVEQLSAELEEFADEFLRGDGPGPSAMC